VFYEIKNHYEQKKDKEGSKQGRKLQFDVLLVFPSHFTMMILDSLF